MGHLEGFEVALGDDGFFVFSREYVQDVFGVYFFVFGDGEENVEICFIPDGKREHMVCDGKAFYFNLLVGEECF